MKRCKCEHWQTCPTCYPQGFDEHGARKPVEIPSSREELQREITTLREQVEKLTKELSVLKTTPPHLRQDLHCVASDLSAQVRERDEQLTAALAACEKKDEALDADNSKMARTAADAIRARRNHG